ncbi:MAG: hypothetical protein HYX21_01905 [Candidatus Yanofskybacteria bacterium]|nr:hypothetical protein [Candidatus Yanofskybacteria bacterium]
MRSDKSQALKLRLAGKSYNEISVFLGIPKATLSDWFSKLELPQKAKERLNKRLYQKAVSALIKRNRAQTHFAQQNARNIRNTAKKEISGLNRRDIFMLGVSLYWAEGYKRPIVAKGKIKTHHPVSLTNSDYELVKVFLKFLRETCQVPEEKITGEIRVYEHHSEAYLLNFWNKATNIPFSRLKTIKNGVSISSQRVRPYNILPNGTIQIRVNSTNLYHRIMGWIEGLTEI